MKNFFLIGLLLCPTLLQSQWITKNIKDPFSGKKEVWTSLLLLSGYNYDCDGVIETAFVLENDTISLRIQWSPPPPSWRHGVESGASMLVRLNTRDVFELKNQYEERVSNIDTNTRQTLNLTYHGDISRFGDGLVTHIRIYTTKGYVTIEVREKNAKELLKQYQLFEKALNE